MGLATKIKQKLTPDPPEFVHMRGSETNMHLGTNVRGAPPKTTLAGDATAKHNGADKTPPFRGHMPRDSGIDIGYDSHFREHFDDDISVPRRATTEDFGADMRDPAWDPLSAHPCGSSAQAARIDAVAGTEYICIGRIRGTSSSQGDESSREE